MRTETFKTPGAVRLDIRNGAGEVRLDAGSSQDETTVTLEPLRDNESSTEAIQTARVELHERADGQDVVIDVRGRSKWFRGAEVLIAVTCPLEPAVEIKTGSADIEGRGLMKSVDVETGSGDVQFADISGDAEVSAASGDVQISLIGGEARLNTASGDIQVGMIGGDGRVNSASGDVMIRTAGGRFEANSASGDVQVKEALGSVSANTASGDQQIGSVIQDSVNLRSASGDIRVGIKEGSRLYVDARSRSGDVTSELPVSDAPPEGDAPLIELRANTMSGDITIHRAGR
jgi:putative adhesin